MKEFSDLMDRALDAYNEVIKNREKLFAAFIAETGLPPTKCVICEQRHPDGSYRVWIRPKTEKEMSGEAEDLTSNPNL
jgi:hypothetical protein